MTRCQYLKKIDIARKKGIAYLDNGDVLICWDSSCGGGFSLKSSDGQTIDTACDPMRFAYILDDYFPLRRAERKITQ